MEIFDFAGYQQAVRARFSHACQEPVAIDVLLPLLRQFAAEAEETIERQPDDRSLLACGPGCKTCCVVNVATLIPEGVAIARQIQNLGAEQVQKTKDRLELLWRDVRGLEDEDRLCMRRPCAFLDENGSCAIYSVRPLLCRSLTSTDAQSCRDALDSVLLGEEKAIMAHQFQLQLYEGLFKGVAEGLEEAGLDGRSFELSGLLRYLLLHPQGEADWLTGRRLSWLDIF